MKDQEMRFPLNVRRIVLVVLDGLRPDAVDAFDMRHLARLARRSAHTFEAETVSPSVTAACMASLFSGVSPDVHGLRSERFHIPRARGPIDLLPRILAEAALPSSAFVRQVPVLMRGTAARIARHLGFTHSAFIAGGATAVMGAALGTALTQREGLIVMHWPDCDQAGHDHGWMSEPYGRAARLLDGTLGALLGVLDLEHDPSTVFIALADHGGGGAVPNHHDSDHPLDRTIPILVAGRAVEPGVLGGSVTLLDVPATVLWALGLCVPQSYQGRPLIGAFAGTTEVAA